MATLVFLSSNIVLTAKLVVRVDQEKFREFALGKIVINTGPQNGTNSYLTDDASFYYLYMGEPGLNLPHSTIIKAEVVRNEGLINLY